MVHVRTRIHADPIGKRTFQRLSDLIDTRKQSDAFAPVTVIVPSQYAGVMLRRALAADQGLLNVRFMTLPRLAEYLGSPTLAKIGKVPLTPLVELASVRYVATECGVDGPLRTVSHHPGLPGLLQRTFTELSRLEKTDLSDLADTDDLRAQLVDWYLLFRDETRGYYVHEDLVRAAEGAVLKGLAADTLRDIGYVLFYLLNDLTCTEIRLIKSLIVRNEAAVILGMTGETETDEDTLCMKAAISGDDRMTLTGDDFKNQPPIQLLSAPDAREEIRWIVRDIARRCEDGTPFHKIAVLYRQREPYSSLIPTQLVLAGIPVSGPDPTPLNSTPSGRLLLGMLGVINSDLSRPEMLRWLSESPVQVRSYGRDPRRLFADWEVVSRKAGIVKGIEQWEDRLTVLGNQLTHQATVAEDREETSVAKLEGLRRLACAADSLLEFVRDFSDRTGTPPEDTWEGLSRWTKRLLMYFAWPEDDWPSEHSANHERLLGVLDEFGSLDSTTFRPIKDVFLEMLGQRLETPSGRLGETGAGVFIASIETVKGMTFDAVYLVGMSEGEFPASPPLDSLMPYEKRKSVADGFVLESQHTFRMKERRAFLGAQASAGEYTLSYPRADSNSQRPRFPSPWFMDALAVLNGGPVGSTDIPQLSHENWLEVIQSPLHSLGYAETLAVADIHDRDVSSVSRWRTSGHAMKDHYLASAGGMIARSIALTESRRSRQLTGWDGDVSGHLNAGSMLRKGPLSATGLESWARCPFSYFLGHVLGVRALDSPEDVLTISALDRGSLVHRILERVVEGIEGEDGSGTAEVMMAEQVQVLLKIAEEEFNRAEMRGITGKPLLWTAAKNEILRDMRWFLDEDQSWLEKQGLYPVWTEKSFGFGRRDSLEPLKIILKDGVELSFRGMIDRVDVSKDKKRIVVTDYKTGSSYSYREMNKDPLDAGRRLQLPIYVLVAKRELPEAEQAQGSYWFVSSRENFERNLIDFEQVEERFNQVVEDISAGIHNGLFPANPGLPVRHGLENCSYCDFDRICHADRAALWDLKKGDARLASYTGLSDVTDDLAELP